MYAACDVTGKPQIIYMAAYGAKLAAMASVGLTEAQARAVGHDMLTSVLPLDNEPCTLAARDTRGLGSRGVGRCEALLHRCSVCEQPGRRGPGPREGGIRPELPTACRVEDQIRSDERALSLSI